MESKLKLINDIIKIAYYVGAVLPLIMALIALPFLPDLIPIHYNAQHKVDVMGNTNEILLIAGILSGAALLWGLCIKSISAFVGVIARKVTKTSQTVSKTSEPEKTQIESENKQENTENVENAQNAQNKQVSTENKPKTDSHLLPVYITELYLYISSLLLPIIYIILMGFIIYTSYHQITDISEYMKFLDSFVEWEKDYMKTIQPYM